ncbi:MAG: tetratricopeptide repeat protein [Vicinamibacterales bacterium]
MATSTDQPFSGLQVTVVGRLSLLTKRDVRSVVERLGGTFAPELTTRTSVVVSTSEVVDLPAGTRVMGENELCLAAGLPDLTTLRSQYYSARDVRGMYPVVTDDHLHYLTRWGLVRPVVGRYSFADVHVVRQAASEIERGVTLAALLRTLSAQRQGQLALDFQAHVDRPAARVVSLTTKQTPAPQASLFAADRAAELAAANRSLAAQYFLEGAQLDDGERRDLDAAAAAYRRAALFDPELVPAIVNLANIYYERDELVEAEALYEKAVRLDPDCFEAHFNMGNIHHDLGRFGEAIAAYRAALAISPAYPDAHFYLAVTLEKLGRSAEARPHWREYRQLAPDGEFVELAREFTE